MRVLFCTDGSDVSKNAVLNFSKWAKKDTVVDVLCVIDWSFLTDDASVEDSKFLSYCTNSADKILENVSEFIAFNSIKQGKLIKICGATVDTILEICESNPYDAIILGSNSKKGLEKVLGSVSNSIINHAKISTYVAKFENNTKRVLFTVNLDNILENIVGKFIRNFDLDGKEIFITTVYDIPQYLFTDSSSYMDWMFEIQKRQELEGILLLNQVEKLFEEFGYKVAAKSVLKGSPSEKIVEYALNKEMDLIVCAHLHKSKLSRFISTSVSKKILEQSKSDLIILH